MKKTVFAALPVLLLLAGTARIAGAVDTIVTYPGGSSGSVQVNKRGVFYGDSYFTYSTSTHRLSVSSFTVGAMAGAGLVTCGDSSHALSWTGGTFGCQSVSGGGGGGGSTALGVNLNGVVITTPTAALNFVTPFIVTSVSGGTTAQMSLDPSSVTLSGPLSATAPVIKTGGVFSLNPSSVTMRGPDPALGGDLSGTISNAVLNLVDISAKTNLAVSAPVTLTGDTVGVDKSSMTLLGPTIDAAELPADGYASTYVNVTGDSMTGQLTVGGSSLTVTGASGIRASFGISGGSLTARNLASTLVAVDANGVLIGTTVVSGSGGSSALAIATGSALVSTIVSSPTARVIFDSATITAALQGTTSTFLSLNPSSVTLRGPNVINLQSVFQGAGTTMNIDSGTVNVLRTTTMTIAQDLIVGDDATIAGGLTVSGGSGLTLAALATNECVQTNGSSRLTTTGAACISLNSTNTWTAPQVWSSPSPSTFTYGLAAGSFTVSGSTDNLRIRESGLFGLVQISTALAINGQALVAYSSFTVGPTGLRSTLLAVDASGVLISTTVAAGSGGGGSGSGTIVVTPQFQVPFMRDVSSNVVTSSGNFTNNGTTVTLSNTAVFYQAGVASVTATSVLFDYRSSSVTVSSLTVTGSALNVNGINYAWPSSQSSNYLKNDGSGNLTWAAASGGGGGGSGTITSSTPTLLSQYSATTTLSGFDLFATTNSWTAGQTITSPSGLTLSGGSLTMSTGQSILLNNADNTGQFSLYNGGATGLNAMRVGTKDVSFGTSVTATSGSGVLVSTITASSATYKTFNTTGTYTAFGTIAVSSSIHLSGSVGTSGQVITSGGPGAVPTWTTPTTGDITAVIAGTGLSGGAASGDATISAVSTTAYTSSTQTFTAQPTFQNTVILSSTIALGTSAGTGVSGQVFTSQSGVTPVWSDINKTTYTWTAQQTHSNTVIFSTTVALGAASGTGVAGQFFTSQGQTTNPSYTSVNATTYTWTAQQTHNNTVIISTSISLNGATNTGTSGQVLTSGGQGLPTWTTPSAAGIISAGTFTWVNPFGISGSTLAFSSAVFALNGAVPNVNLTNTPLHVIGSTDSSIQLNVQNFSAGTNASSDFVATSDLGGNTSNYINMGINGSHYNQTTFSVTPATWGYLYTSDHGLAIGAGSNGSDSTASLVFWTSSPVTANQRMAITSSGTIITFGNINISSGLLAGNSAGVLGQVITSGGPGAVPTWSTPSGAGDVLKASTQVFTGGDTFVSTVSFSSTTVMQNTGGLIFDGNTSLLMPGASFYAAGAVDFKAPASSVTFSSNAVTNGDLRISSVAIFAATTIPGASITNGMMWNDTTQKALKYTNTSASTTLSGVMWTVKDSSNTNTSSLPVSLFDDAKGIGTLQIPANFLTVGKTIFVVMAGTFTTTGTPFVVSSITVGGTAVAAASGPITMGVAPTTNASFMMQVVFTCYSTGTSGVVRGSGGLEFFNTGAVGTNIHMRFPTTVPTVNTTIANAIQWSFQWGTSSSSNGISLLNGFVEVKN